MYSIRIFAACSAWVSLLEFQETKQGNILNLLCNFHEYYFKYNLVRDKRNWENGWMYDSHLPNQNKSDTKPSKTVTWRNVFHRCIGPQIWNALRKLSNLGININRILCYLTWAKEQGLDFSDHRVTTYEIKVPAEKYFLRYRYTCIEGKDVPFFQGHIPNIQVRDISKEGLCEVSSEWILILT